MNEYLPNISAANNPAVSINTLLNTVPALSWQGADISVLMVGGASAGYSKTFGQDNGSFDILDLNPLFLFDYKNLFFLNTALDFTIDDQGNTDVSLDTANFNLILNDYMIFGMGKFDSPLGYFVQNLSPSWINLLPDAPVGFDDDEAAPQSEVGAELRGGFPLVANMQANYIFFVANGSQGMVDTAGGIIDHISTDGYANNHGNYLYGVRFGILPIPKLEVGISAALGKLALIDMADGTSVLQDSRNYSVLGTDVSYKWNNLDLRAEFIEQHIPSQAGSITPAAETWKAWYLQTAYRIPTTRFEPVIRFSKYIAPITNQRQQQWAFGLDYWLAPSIAAQAAYEVNKGEQGTANNDNRFLLQLVFGY